VCPLQSPGSSGILESWSASQGTSFRHGQVLGRVTGVGGVPRVSRVIKAPGPGLVGLKAVADRTYVRAGQTLAVGYDPQRVYITARVPETDVRRVRVGDAAEVRLDAYPNRVVAGVVEQLQASAAGNFTIYPSVAIPPDDQFGPSGAREQAAAVIARSGVLVAMPCSGRGRHPGRRDRNY
jgi:hypothetical protein